MASSSMIMVISFMVLVEDVGASQDSPFRSAQRLKKACVPRSTVWPKDGRLNSMCSKKQVDGIKLYPTHAWLLDVRVED